MKRLPLLLVLGLAAGCASWTDQPVIEGCENLDSFGRCTDTAPGTGGGGGSDGTGGTGGAGNTGGALEGACTNEADQAVYDELTYTNSDGEMFTGTEAASEIGSDCIFGSPESDPPLEGCQMQAVAVLGCAAAGCPQAIIDALADCVTDCTQGATGLSNECVACTGDTVACGAAFCAALCSADSNAPACVTCRCDNGCIPEFETCSGLPQDACQ